MSWDSPSTWHFYKWIPDYWPPEPWQTVGNSGPPEGATIPWWLEPKSQWPYPAPWEMKVLGAFPAMWFKMREDIGAPVTDPPGPWPSTPTFPKPAGLMRVKTPAYAPGTKIPIGSIKVHMRPLDWLDVSPHPSLWAQGKFEEALRVMSQRRPVRIVTEEGSITLKSIRSANWNQHQKDYKEYRAAVKAKRENEHKERLAAEIVKTRGEPKLSVDLFT